MQSFYCSTFQERKSHCFGHSEPVSPEHHTTSLREQHFTGMNSGLEQGSPSTVMHQEAFFFPILEGKWASTNSDEARSCCLSRKQHGRQDVWCLEGSTRKQEPLLHAQAFTKQPQLLDLLHSFQNPPTCSWRQTSQRLLIPEPHDTSFPNLASSPNLN